MCGNIRVQKRDGPGLDSERFARADEPCVKEFPSSRLVCEEAQRKIVARDAHRTAYATISQTAEIPMPEIFKLTKDERWLVIVCIGIGALIAFPIAIYLFGGKLVDITSLFGSALGAWSGIAGAFWVADRHATRQQRSAAALVRQMLYPVTSALHKLSTMHGPPSRPDRGESDDEPDVRSAADWVSICTQANIVKTQYRDFQSKIHRFETGLNLLSASGLQTALAVESELGSGVFRAADPLTVGNGEDPVYGPGHGPFQAGPPTWSSRNALNALNREIQKLMAQLEKEAS